jgi:hypothetical protein
VLRISFLLLLILVAAACPALPQAEQKTNSTPEGAIPAISAGLGECSADIHVTGTKRKPLYKAKISTEIKYGFGGFHRLSLEIYTDVNGNARFEGLPERPRQPLSFEVTYEGRKTAVIVHPIQQCHGTYDAIVTDKPVEDQADSEQ